MKTPEVVEEAAWGSPCYQALLELRDCVLRKPLGLHFSAKDLSEDEDQRHFGIWRPDGRAVACAVVVSLDSHTWKVRQMAVAEECRGDGLGRAVLTKLLEEASNTGVSELVLHARENARGFYERIGFAAEGSPFEEVGLVHFKMKMKTAHSGYGE